MRKILLLTFIFAFIAGVYAQKRFTRQAESIFEPGNKYSNIPFSGRSGHPASSGLFPGGISAGLTLESDSVDFVGAWPFGPASAVAVDEDNNLAFLGSGGGVYILDISDPANPLEL